MNNLSASYQQGTPSATGRLPNENNVGGRWPLEIPPEAIEEYMEEITACTNIDNIIGGLPAPSEVRNAASTANPGRGFTSPRLRPSPATATAGATQKSRRIYTEEEIRKRRAERQKTYRERRHQAGAEVKKKLSTTAAEIEAAHQEQDSLLLQQSALPLIVEYWTCCLNTAQSLVSNVVSRVRSECQSVVEGLGWLGLQVFSPSDAQLHSFLDRKSTDELAALGGNMTQRSGNLYARWEAEPDARPKIEAQLLRMRDLRMRGAKYLAETRPDVTIELVRRRIIPVGPDGAPNPKLVEIVAKMELTPEQLESFEREWNLYLQRTESIRQEARSVISFLSSSEDAAAFCSFAAAGLLLERLEAVQELETHPKSEAHALVNFSLWLPANCTMQQKATLMGGCAPYAPDFIQIGRLLFDDTPGDDIIEV